MSAKCGKRCAERGCQSPRKHTGPNAKFCPPCSNLVSADKTVGELCLRCQWLYYEWACRVLKAPRFPRPKQLPLSGPEKKGAA